MEEGAAESRGREQGIHRREHETCEGAGGILYLDLGGGDLGV